MLGCMRWGIKRGHMMGHMGEEDFFGEKEVLYYWLSFICLNRDTGVVLCMLMPE